jgi:hypothetical protein
MGAQRLGVGRPDVVPLPPDRGHEGPVLRLDRVDLPVDGPLAVPVGDHQLVLGQPQAQAGRDQLHADPEAPGQQAAVGEGPDRAGLEPQRGGAHVEDVAGSVR